MTKTSKNKTNKILKGAVLGVACVISASAIPFAALRDISVAGAAETDLTSTSNSISVSNADKTVEKGKPYNIKAATYMQGTTKLENVLNEDNNGNKSDQGTIKSNITVKYKNSNIEETISPAAAGSTGIAGVFTPTMVGTYTITYTVFDNNKEYSYDYDVTCTVAEARFEFESNAKEVIPSVYDLSLLDATSPKNILLPTPKLIRDDDEEKTVKNVISDSEGGSEYVLISISGGSNSAANLTEALKPVDGQEGKFYIDGSVLKNAGVGEYKVTYTYKQNGQFVASTTKTFEVEENHYKLENKQDATKDYKLKASFASTKPTKASTGVAVSLPSVSATTDTNNSPSNESVNVSYTIKAFKRNATTRDYTDEVDDKYIDTVKNTFTAPENGDYKIVYTVRDFYYEEGKDNHQVSNNDLIIYLDKVADDVAPTYAIYNAADGKILDKDGKVDYISAKNDIKSKTVNRNIVLYAIGAKDNASKAEDMTLTRLLRDQSGITRFSVSEYNNYNLILNYKGVESTDAAKQFVSDNVTIADKMAGVDTTSKEAIEQYLRDNKFLVVSNSKTTNPFTGVDYTREDFKDAKIYNAEKTEVVEDLSDVVFKEGEAGFDLARFKKALTLIGVAYVEHNFEYTAQTYNLYYTAQDEAGNKTESEYIRMEIVSNVAYEDTVPPTITFSSSLQNAYLPDDTIIFNAPSASDTEDRNVEAKVYYRYLNGDAELPVTGKSKALTVVTNKNSVVSNTNKWYASQASHVTNAFIEPELNSNGQYTIKLKGEKPDTATHLEIFVMSTDDYGNNGYFSQVVEIAASNDKKAPTLKKVTENSEDNANIKQGKKVTLPTLEYSDDLVGYMSHSVEVFYEVKEGEGAEAKNRYELMPSENSNAIKESYLNRYTLRAGTFTASYAGTYRVVVTVKDAANNSIATFFEYIVNDSAVTENPAIGNLTSETIDLKVDETRHLPAPTIKVADTSASTGAVAYAGYKKDNDVKTALYYNISTSSAETNYYDLTNNYFTGHASGKYEIKYSVYLIKYVVGTANVSVNADGNLEYNGKLVLPDMVNGKLIVGSYDADDMFVEDTSVTEATLEAAKIELVSLPTQVQRFKVTDSQAPVLHMDEYKTQKDYQTHTSLNDTIVVPRINATEESKYGINPEKSYVEITISVASATTSSTTERIYMKDWDNARSGNLFYGAVEGATAGTPDAKNELRLKLVENGNYKFTYSVSDYSGNVATDEISFANGDAERPKITVNEGFLTDTSKKARTNDSYSLNETLVLDTTKLDLFDAVTDVETLKKNMKIKVVNSSTNKEVDMIENTSYNYLLSAAGDYKVTISVTDVAGWTREETVNITVAAKQEGDVRTVYKTVGTILIVLSCLILVGVVGYFIYSKVKLDKELKGANKKRRK